MVVKKLLVIAFISFCFHSLKAKQVSRRNRTNIQKAIEFMTVADRNYAQLAGAAAHALWDWQVNVTECNRKIKEDAANEAADFGKKIYAKARNFKWRTYKGRNYTLYRWFELANKGLLSVESVFYVTAGTVFEGKHERNVERKGFTGRQSTPNTLELSRFLNQVWLNNSKQVEIESLGNTASSNQSLNILNSAFGIMVVVALAYLKKFVTKRLLEEEHCVGQRTMQHLDFELDGKGQSEKVSAFSEMSEIFNKVKICPYKRSAKDCRMTLADITKLFTTSRDPEELKYYWLRFRKETGEKYKDLFLRSIKEDNKWAKGFGYKNKAEYNVAMYEDKDFLQNMAKEMEKIMPLYKQIQAYIRKKLRAFYKNENIRRDGPIPAHLLGNMYAQKWMNIFPLVKPYPESSGLPNVTKAMKRKKMKPIDMFLMAERFFASIGLKNMTPSFWKKSVITKLKGLDMDCHASAHDFFDGKNFRIKMCTEVNSENLVTIHHEMGHVEYYMHYSHLPVLFRRSANPGFHEAIGDAISLSVLTPDYLRQVGLLKKSENKKDKKFTINYLMNMALIYAVTPSYAYIIDHWRNQVYNGAIKENELNKMYWKYRLKYQGICPPSKRAEKNFDIGAKYHIPAGVEYFRYFVANILQFQIHKILCKEAGHKGPLHDCNIYKSRKAGKAFSALLMQGRSKKWHQILSAFSRKLYNKVDASALLEYFKPLMDWLEKKNVKEYIGWKSKSPMSCPRRKCNITDSGATVMKDFDVTNSDITKMGSSKTEYDTTDFITPNYSANFKQTSLKTESTINLIHYTLHPAGDSPARLAGYAKTISRPTMFQAATSGTEVQRIMSIGRTGSKASAPRITVSGKERLGTTMLGIALDGKTVAGKEGFRKTTTGTPVSEKIVTLESKAETTVIRTTVSGTKTSRTTLSGTETSRTTLSGTETSKTTLSGTEIRGTSINGTEKPEMTANETIETETEITKTAVSKTTLSVTTVKERVGQSKLTSGQSAIKTKITETTVPTTTDSSVSLTSDLETVSGALTDFIVSVAETPTTLSEGTIASDSRAASTVLTGSTLPIPEKAKTRSGSSVATDSDTFATAKTGTSEIITEITKNRSASSGATVPQKVTDLSKDSISTDYETKESEFTGSSAALSEITETQTESSIKLHSGTTRRTPTDSIATASKITMTHPSGSAASKTRTEMTDSSVSLTSNLETVSGALTDFIISVAETPTTLSEGTMASDSRADSTVLIGSTLPIPEKAKTRSGSSEATDSVTFATAKTDASELITEITKNRSASSGATVPQKVTDLSKDSISTDYEIKESKFTVSSKAVSEITETQTESSIKLHSGTTRRTPTDSIATASKITMTHPSGSAASKTRTEMTDSSVSLTSNLETVSGALTDFIVSVAETPTSLSEGTMSSHSRADSTVLTGSTLAIPEKATTLSKNSVATDSDTFATAKTGPSVLITEITKNRSASSGSTVPQKVTDLSKDSISTDYEIKESKFTGSSKAVSEITETLTESSIKLHSGTTRRTPRDSIATASKITMTHPSGSAASKTRTEMTDSSVSLTSNLETVSGALTDFIVSVAETPTTLSEGTMASDSRADSTVLIGSTLPIPEKAKTRSGSSVATDSDTFTTAKTDPSELITEITKNRSASSGSTVPQKVTDLSEDSISTDYEIKESKFTGSSKAVSGITETLTESSIKLHSRTTRRTPTDSIATASKITMTHPSGSAASKTRTEMTDSSVSLTSNLETVSGSLTDFIVSVAETPTTLSEGTMASDSRADSTVLIGSTLTIPEKATTRSGSSEATDYDTFATAKTGASELITEITKNTSASSRATVPQKATDSVTKESEFTVSSRTVSKIAETSTESLIVPHSETARRTLTDSVATVPEVTTIRPFESTVASGMVESSVSLTSDSESAAASLTDSLVSVHEATINSSVIFASSISETLSETLTSSTAEVTEIDTSPTAGSFEGVSRTMSVESLDSITPDSRTLALTTLPGSIATTSEIAATLSTISSVPVSATSMAALKSSAASMSKLATSFSIGSTKVISEAPTSDSVGSIASDSETISTGTVILITDIVTTQEPASEELVSISGSTETSDLKGVVSEISTTGLLASQPAESDFLTKAETVSTVDLMTAETVLLKEKEPIDVLPETTLSGEYEQENVEDQLVKFVKNMMMG